ncbi:DUF4065 domain-containing protein [Enterococcus faecalis]|nr:DUF4065 domain-containing protein [Enterococcus faecalis]
MFRHVIILLNSDKFKSRVAFVKTDEEVIEYHKIKSVIDVVQSMYNEEYVVHRMITNSNSVESISICDPFFKGVEMYTDEEAFTKLLKDNFEESYLDPLDIAEYILSIKGMTHLRLQKILYMIYAECLFEGEKLFKQNPVAFTYGPVYLSVYHKYKHGNKKVEKANISKITVKSLLDNKKLACLNDAVEKVLSITEGKKDSEIVSATHVKDSPWALVFEEGKNGIITDDLILSNHNRVKDFLVVN